MDINSIGQSSINDSQYLNKPNNFEMEKSQNETKEIRTQDFKGEDIKRVIEKMDSKLSGENQELRFSIHEKTKQILVKIVDSQTNQVIKEIPSEKIADMVASMCEAAGLLIDEKR